MKGERLKHQLSDTPTVVHLFNSFTHRRSTIVSLETSHVMSPWWPSLCCIHFQWQIDFHWGVTGALPASIHTLLRAELKLTFLLFRGNLISDRICVWHVISLCCSCSCCSRLFSLLRKSEINSAELFCDDDRPVLKCQTVSQITCTLESLVCDHIHSGLGDGICLPIPPPPSLGMQKNTTEKSPNVACGLYNASVNGCTEPVFCPNKVIFALIIWVTNYSLLLKQITCVLSKIK